MRKNSVAIWYLKNRLSLLKTLATIIALVNILNLYSLLTIARGSNDECLWLNKEKTSQGMLLLFDKVKEDGVAAKAGIKNMDMLAAINHQRFYSSFEAQRLLNQVPEGEFVTYTIIRGDQVFDVRVQVKKLVDFVNLGFSLLACIWFLIGLLVIMAKPEGEIQRLFFKIGILLSITRSFGIILPFVTNLAHTFLFDVYFIVLLAAFALFPYYYLRFFSLFPRRLWKNNRPIFYKLLFAFSLIFAVMALYYYYTLPRMPDPVRGMNILSEVNFTARLGGVLNLSYFTIYIGYVFLLINFFKMDRTQRRKVSLIVIAYSLSFISFIFIAAVAPNLGYVVFNSPEYFAPVILVALLPVAFGISILKYDLMDVGYVVKNTVSYGVATIGIVILYLLLVLGLGNMIGGFVASPYRNLVTLFLFIVFAVLFQRIKDYLQLALTRRFYPEQFAYQKVLGTFHQELAQIVGRGNIVNAIERLFTEVIRIKRFALLLEDYETGGYKYARASGFLPTEKNVHVHMNSLKQYVTLRREVSSLPVIDQPAFAEFFPKDTSELIENGIYTIVPLISGKNIIGFLLLGLKRSGSIFDAQDMELLASVAGQLAISMENARLYEAEAEKQKLERDLELARKIQQSLLPQVIPNDSRIDMYGEMIPAQHIGGDYYDIIQRDMDNYFVIIGDVSGKGLPASLYMAKVQTLVQIECMLKESPKDILIEVNRKLFGILDPHSYVTMSLAHFDLKNRRVKFCRAGHLPLIIRENGTICEIKSAGIGLGLDKGAIFSSSLKEEEIPLREGQLFVFITDGINETMDEGNNLMGYDELNESLARSRNLSCREIAADIWNTVTSFQRNAAQHDDMTLVLMRILA